jgi:amphi-Trp domain-containing protein
MPAKPEKDIEKAYPTKDFVAKLRRLADALENGKRFQIQIAGERISIPVGATFNTEHEREGNQAAIEFQVRRTMA